MKIAILVTQDKQDELLKKFTAKWPDYQFDLES